MIRIQYTGSHEALKGEVGTIVEDDFGMFRVEWDSHFVHTWLFEEDFKIL